MQLGQFMRTGPRIWLGSYTANLMPVTLNANRHTVHPIELIDYWAGFGHETVMDLGFFDVWDFQENISSVEKLLIKGSLILEFPELPDEFTREDRPWHSSEQITKGADTFEEAIRTLENRHKIMKLKDLIIAQYGEVPIWTASEEFKEAPKFSGLKEEMKLPPDATDIQVIEAANNLGRLDLFKALDECMNAWLAKAHRCNYEFKPSGELRRITF